MTYRRFLAFGIALLLGGSAQAFGQIRGGSINGIVEDQQGGVLPGTTVTVLGRDATHVFVTGVDGEFRFLNLAPGPYQITATLAGFTTLIRDSVMVAVGQTVTLPLSLKVAAVSETIRVSGATPIVDRAAGGTSINFSSDELAKVPTSRDPFSLLRVVPGVLLDRVNVAGNETGQAPAIVSKAARPQDTTWTLDGIEITDMGAAGSSPTYFNFDNFEEIRVSTAGNDIQARTGGLGLDFIVKRGTNQFRGEARGYFTNNAMESSNVPDELSAAGVTPDTADHMEQVSDYGFDLGGPLVKDRAWFYGSYSSQDIRLYRRSTRSVDRTELKNPNVKLNWQATKNDMISFLYFNGYKLKDNRPLGIPGINFEAPTATFHQDNYYSDFPLHGLWKVGDDRVISSNMFLSVNYAYYNTGNALTPMGGSEMQAGRSFVTSQSYGSTQSSLNTRPQQVVTANAHSFVRGFGGSHDVRYGFGFRTTDVFAATRWPGNGILAIEQTVTDLRAQVFREGNGGNRVNYLNFYAADRLALNRATIDIGLRYDHQSGKALPSQTSANVAFPSVVPGIDFAGYDAPFTWRNLSPRVGVSYALDAQQRTIARINYSRYAGQLASSTIGFMNPSSVAGSRTFRWVETNGDHFSQADEVLLDQPIGSPGGGFNPANPTAVTSSNQIDPNLKAPVTQAFVAAVEREVMPDLAVQVNYSYSRTSNLFGNFSANLTPRVGVTLADYAAGPPLTGTLPDGTPYSVATFVPDAAKVAASGGGIVEQNAPGYVTDYHGLEVTMVKRLSNRWMGRVSLSYNNAREHFDDPRGIYDTNGNPTPTVTEPLVDGGQFAPSSAGSSGGTVYLNAKWQFNANAMYEAPYGLEVSANVFARQGYPFPLFRQTALGADTLQVLVTPRIDTFRYPDMWSTDVRVARTFRARMVNVRAIADLFNLFNANTELVRVNNLGATNFNALVQNLSPRALRLGLSVTF